MIKKIIYLVIGATLFVLAAEKNASATTTPPSGRIILITGSCSSGKSTLARNIANKLNAKYFAFDEYVMPIILNNIIAQYVGKPLAYLLTKL